MGAYRYFGLQGIAAPEIMPLRQKPRRWMRWHLLVSLGLGPSPCLLPSLIALSIDIQFIPINNILCQNILGGDGGI